jgi:hypothetical protein
MAAPNDYLYKLVATTEPKGTVRPQSPFAELKQAKDLASAEDLNQAGFLMVPSLSTADSKWHLRTPFFGSDYYIDDTAGKPVLKISNLGYHSCTEELDSNRPLYTSNTDSPSTPIRIMRGLGDTHTATLTFRPDRPSDVLETADTVYRIFDFGGDRVAYVGDQVAASITLHLFSPNVVEVKASHNVPLLIHTFIYLARLEHLSQ